MRNLLWALVSAMLASVAACAPAPSAAAVLTLERRIPLGVVNGRIDHLALDEASGRLFVAELGNDSVDVVDLKAGKATARIDGLHQPQGVGFVASTHELYVADGGDGSVRIFGGAGLTPVGRIDLGNDADNVRVEQGGRLVLVGYGDGALAVVDARTRAVVSKIPLAAHPESFQLDPAGGAIYVNLPNAHRIAVVDRVTGHSNRTLPVGLAFANFPMALDGHGHRLAVVFRAPAELRVFDLKVGKAVANLNVCSDADDVFFDEKRDRIYVICGQGVVDVVARHGPTYQRVARIPTAAGARTAMWSPSDGRLYIAAPARAGAGASILVLRASE
ncbi:MAG TPA: YncE family protein [Caulobacteraceae bacterium]